MLTRQRSQSEHSDRQLILPNDRLAIVMVGLPARGKSFMAKKIYRYLHHLDIITKVFNFGSYRRIATKNITVGKASASFFDPDNKQGAKIRRQCCIEALHDLISWYNTGGQIGILDATNTTLERRKLIREFFQSKKSELEYNVSILHVESICNDEAIIHNNIISVKLKNPDYCTVDAKKAIKDFKERIKMYKKVYAEVKKSEGSYIKVIDVGTEVMGYMIDDYVSCRIFYFLMHLHLHRLSKTPKKPLLMQLKNYFENKKDTEMANKLKEMAASVGAKFQRPAYDRPVHALAPHMRRASYLMWTDAEDTYKATPYSQRGNPNNKINVNVKPHYINTPQNVKVKPQSGHGSVNKTPMKSMNNSNDSSFKVTPLKIDKIISNHSTPINLINQSVTSTTPKAQDITSVGPYLRIRPKVRKSTLIHRMVSTRDIIPTHGSPNNATTVLLRNTSNQSTESVSGYNSDNEEDSDDMHEYINDTKTKKNSKKNKKKSDNKYSKQGIKLLSDTDIVMPPAHYNAVVTPIIENTIEYKTSDIEGIDEEEEEDFINEQNGISNNGSGNEDFHCELCGRTVLKKDTSLVERRHNENEKVRICEVCLYETDSEDDSNEIMNYNSVEMMNFMHSGPTTASHSPKNDGQEYGYDTVKMGNVQKRVQEMENSVNIILNQLDDNKEENINKNFKQELIRLQQKMQELFQ